MHTFLKKVLKIDLVKFYLTLQINKKGETINGRRKK